MQRHLDPATLERQALEAFAEVAEKARRVFAWVADRAWASAEAQAAARAGLRALAAVERVAPRMIAEAVRRLDEALRRALRTGEGGVVGRGQVNGHVEARAPERAPPELEAPPEPSRGPASSRAADEVIAARRRLASDFYRRSGYSEERIADHLKGIDLTQPVEVVRIPKGTRFVQYQVDGPWQGNYYADVGALPDEVGISPLGMDRATGEVVNKVGNIHEASGNVQMLRSTAASVEDTWSVPGERHLAPGGEYQFFTSEKSLLPKIGRLK